MRADEFDVVVLGGGPAGVTAALRARELGANVALVERARLGGTCTNDGCVPTRVLAKAARLRREADQFSDYGLVTSAFEMDFARLMSRTQQTVYRIHEKKQIEEHLSRAGVTVITNSGSAAFIDEHTLGLQGDATIKGDKIIICVGGHARRLPFPGSEHTLTHHDIWSLQELPRSIAIIGGAASGCQLATCLSAFDAQVRVFEIGAHILGVEDESVSLAMETAFASREIEIINEISGVERIEKSAAGLRLYYGRNGEQLSIEVEAVIVAAGWAGNVEALNLEAAGVKTERSYILVDDYMRTSNEHIFAAGDITGRMMLVQSGGYEGRIAAENAVLGIGQPYKHLIVPHGGFTDPEYASVGLTEAKARLVEPDCLVAVVPYIDLDRAVIDDHLEGFCKLIVSRENHRILGAHIVGEQALEIIQLVAVGMAADMWVEQLAELELAYPTYTAVVGLAARQIIRELGVMPLAPQWRALRKEHAAEWERSEK